MIDALLEIQFAEPERAKSFDCQKCPASIQKLRRCQENKIFTSDDGNIWPMRVSEGGSLFGFCPGKAQKDARVVLLYRALVLAAETGINWQSGGISEQPTWWVELASSFLTRYNELRFISRAKAILGDGKGAKNGSNKRQPDVQNRSKHSGR